MSSCCVLSLMAMAGGISERMLTSWSSCKSSYLSLYMPEITLNKLLFA